MGRVAAFFKHAFAVDRAEDFTATEEEMAVLDKLASKIVKRGVTLPALLFLETARPLNFIGSQAMALFDPIVRGLFDWKEFSDFHKILARRGSVEVLIQRIERFESAKGKPEAGKEPSDKERE